jgi:hypothetical protein
VKLFWREPLADDRKPQACETIPEMKRGHTMEAGITVIAAKQAGCDRSAQESNAGSFPFY